MSLYLYFVNESPVKIWGLTPAERNSKVLSGKAVCVSDLSAIQPSDQVLILRGDYLFDDRLLNFLVTAPQTMLLVKEGHNRVPVAMYVPGSMARTAVEILKTGRDPGTVEGVAAQTLESISVAFNQQLRKFEPPFVLRVTEDNARELEPMLFDWSYKGVTDLVTKWLWPRPARWAVKQCVRLGLRPNHVTIMSFLLVVLAGYLFAKGHLGWGLLAGWLMTFLDTVDGKLARVTVTSSRFGHYFDHLIDLIHPPFWYLLWGIGLVHTNQYHLNVSLSSLCWIIFVGYIAGRLCEGFFKWYVGSFGIFCWRPVDSFFRLITARRNPCMILLTVCYLAGRPDWGLWAVAFWTAITTVFLMFRLVLGLYQKSKKGDIRSWFEDIDPSSPEKSLAVRWFTRDSPA
ncbi:MAG: CDP-alcohol phosphatidyltransferase [Thermodesulfatator sp.]|nr:MAG: CDP-alcohol phosphatidyltransferase [Thermodesulfatator sp.]